MQVSDAQDLTFVRPTMIKMLNAAYDRVKPDLIVLTGDNILGNHLCDARFGSRKVIHDKEGEYEEMKRAIDVLMRHIAVRNIPFAMIYGNHDDMNRMTKEEQADIYRSYPTCVGLDDPNSPECATYNVPIYSSDGSKLAFNLWMMDSAWEDKSDKKHYTMVKPEAIDWLIRKNEELKRENGGEAVPSILFQHIAIPEELELIEETDATPRKKLFKRYNFTSDGKQAVPGPDGKFYKLKAGCEGDFLEYPGIVEQNGEFDAIKKCEGIKACVFGHDHPNSFSGFVDGIEIMQTPCASFRCYGARNKGVRVFELDESGEYSTYLLDYKELLGNTPMTELRYIWDADDMVYRKIGILATLGIGALATAGVTIWKKL